jgi:hypothetical protein
MKTANPNRRKSANKLEPIDWREYANDAVLKGNMSTLFQRPAAEDASAYASDEAMVEIGKRTRAAGPPVGGKPAVGVAPTVGTQPPGGTGVAPAVSLPTGSNGPTVVIEPAAGLQPTEGMDASAAPSGAVEAVPTEGVTPTAGRPPTVGRRIRPIRGVEDALTLAGQVLYRAMYGPPGRGESRTCAKGYRGLAAETYLDKDTIRDLIAELKGKGILRETGTYNPDTRSSKTYEVLSSESAVALWRAAGIDFVTVGRQRPAFCRQDGVLLTFTPAVG